MPANGRWDLIRRLKVKDRRRLPSGASLLTKRNPVWRRDHSRAIFPTFFVRGPLLASQNDHEYAIFAYVRKECPDDRCQEFNIDISELMADLKTDDAFPVVHVC